MKILHLSDTHGKHRELTDIPSADILVHSGDFTMAGGDMEALDFIEWLCATLEGLPDDVHYLSDNGITIDGISFYGTPMFVTFEDEDLKEIEHYEQIPDNIDILITHRPPLGILDSIDDKLHYGSSILLDKVSKIKPKMHLFGHVHAAYGTIDWKGITFSNAGVTDWKYDVRYAPRLLTY